jgi:PE family
MSYVIAAPEMMTSTAADLATVGSDLSTVHAAAAVPTIALVPAAADEVSADVAHLFSRYAEDFHGLAGRATAFHEQFAPHLTASVHSYAGAEAANTALLHPLTAKVSAIGGTVADSPSEAINFSFLLQVLLSLVVLTFPVSVPLLFLLFIWDEFVKGITGV